MFKVLNKQEIKELQKENHQLKEVVEKIENNKLVLVKEKITKKEHSIVVYEYDRKLYRFVIISIYPLEKTEV